MKRFDWIYQAAVDRKGGSQAVEALLPRPATSSELASRTDAYYLSNLTRRVFRAGLKHSMVDARWPVFEKEFWGFDPEKLVLMSDEQLERKMLNEQLIRHWGKLKSIRKNAQMVLDVSAECHSFGEMLADWPVEDRVGLWHFLAGKGTHLGGRSAPAFLRMVECDTWLPARDVTAGLVAVGVIDRDLKAKRDQRLAQSAFNEWQQQSGRPLCQISRILSLTIG